MGAAPGPGWLAGLPSHCRAALKCALLTSRPLVTAYVALRVENRALGVLGVAGHRLNAGDLATLSILTSELALRLEGSGMRHGASSSPMVDRVYALRLLEEITQPLTALVARAEVMRDLVREDKIDDVVDQLQAMGESAQRLAGWTDVTARVLKPDLEEQPRN
jgi:hypothetical protein